VFVVMMWCCRFAKANDEESDNAFSCGFVFIN
jgi:hypothetical protein